MRDPERINRITNKIARLWHLVPDQRMPQMLENYVYPAIVVKHKSISLLPWGEEDDKLEKKLDAAYGLVTKQREEQGIGKTARTTELTIEQIEEYEKKERELLKRLKKLMKTPLGMKLYRSWIETLRSDRKANGGTIEKIAPNTCKLTPSPPAKCNCYPGNDPKNRCIYPIMHKGRCSYEALICQCGHDLVRSQGKLVHFFGVHGIEGRCSARDNKGKQCECKKAEIRRD